MAVAAAWMSNRLQMFNQTETSCQISEMIIGDHSKCESTSFQRTHNQLRKFDYL